MGSSIGKPALTALIVLAGILFAVNMCYAANPPLCPHVIGWNNDINTWAQGAPWIKVIFAGDIAPAKATGAKVFYRPFNTDPPYFDNGCLPAARTGATFADTVWAQISGLSQKPDAISYRNEFDWVNPTDSKRTCAEFINYKNRLRELGYTGKVIFGSFSPDWVSASTWQDPDLMAAVNASDGVETHEYFDFQVNCCLPNRCFRHRDIAIANNPYLQTKDWYIGEFGSDVDHGPCSYCGDGLWRTGWRDRGKLTEQQYIEQMTIYRTGCANQVIAVFVFQQGDQTSWSNYEVIGTSVATYMRSTWFPPPGRFVGGVFSSTGGGISAATLTANPGAITSKTLTGGLYNFTLLPGVYSLTASKSGYGTQTIGNLTITSSLNTKVNFTLSPLTPISAAKKLADNATTAVSGVVTARFPVSGSQSLIYVEDSNRISGLAVSTTTPVSPSDQVHATGSMSTLAGERIITATNVTIVQSGAAMPKPMGLSNLWLGGGQFGNQPAVLNNYLTNDYSKGLNNTGLLVQVWGKVSYIDPNSAYFYIDDGSGINDGSGHAGIYVSCADLPLPSSEAYVRIIGVSSVTQVDGRSVRCLRPRSISDLSYARGN